MAKFDIGLKSLEELTAEIEAKSSLSDELFMPTVGQTNSNKIIEIPIGKIDDFENHPYKVIDDDAMMQLAASIKANGVLVPVRVRKKENGRYENISGHRRKRASILAGLDYLPAIVEDMSDEEATIAMVDSNLQREKILPSEKAFAYKMKYDAIKIQQMNASQVGTKRSDDILAEQTGESRNQVQRYIRLTYLMPELLDMTDAGKLKFNPAVEISYLSEEMQKALLEVIEEDKVMPSLVQATAIKELAKEVGDITADDIRNLLKKPQKPAALDTKRIMQLVPPFVSKGEENDFIEKAIKHYLNFVDEDGE